MIITEQLSIQCPECGNTDFSFPQNVQDDDFVTCSNCNFEIIFSDLKQIGLHQAEQYVIDEANKRMQKQFKGMFKKR